MAHEVIVRDVNYLPVMAALTQATSEVKMLRCDASGLLLAGVSAAPATYNKQLRKVVAAGATAVCTFLTTAAAQAHAKAVKVRIQDTNVLAPANGNINYVRYETAGGAAATANNMFWLSGEVETLPEFDTGEIRFINSADQSVTITIDAYGTEDISGSTFA